MIKSVQGEFDFIVIGAGSAGCAVAAQLAHAKLGSVAVLEAGPSDAAARIKVPFGLLFAMNSRRDWRYRSSPQQALGGRRVNINRGKTLGGSSSINSMVWFRGRRDDFDNWGLPGWRWADVEPAFEAIERSIQPARLADPHPLSEGFGRSFGDADALPPNPEYESAGVFHTNMRHGRRWSAADAFLRPALRGEQLTLLRDAQVDRLLLEQGRVNAVQLCDGRRLKARCGVVLSAGSIGSAAIALRSGIGPAKQLRELGITVQIDAPQVGHNLHDHPAVGLHHAGVHSGYGLVLNQALPWALSPLQWLLQRRGRMSSNFVEAGAFFRAIPPAPDGDNRPDVQVHFIPYMMGYRGKSITTGSGYYADVCVSRPRSRGLLKLNSKDPHASPLIDLNLLDDPHDSQTLVAGIKRLRQLLQADHLGVHRAPEVYPANRAKTDTELLQYVREHTATAYHPVGTLAMGGANTPVTPTCQLRGTQNLWVADASIMPSITSANTNAPSMMIGHRAAELIVEWLRRR